MSVNVSSENYYKIVLSSKVIAVLLSYWRA